MKDANYTECEFSAELLPYMYGELEADRISAFESHIADCTACTDDFAQLAVARFEVYEWKQIEFQPLATPAIQIPYERLPAMSWFARIRTAFTQGWAVPAAALAGLALVAVFAGSLIPTSGDQAKSNGSSSGQQAPVLADTPPAAPPVDQASANKEDQPEVTRKRTEPVRASAPRTTTPRRPTRETRVRPVTKAPPTTVVASRRLTPTLNDFPEEEDTSLRLAELFDDVGARENN